MTALVTGSKGGSTTTPTQADQSLTSTAYAQILDLISEGPIYGPADASGLIARSTYCNDTVLQNADGSYNFTFKQLDFRAGSLDQAYITGFDTSRSDTAVGVELKAVAPWTHTVTNLTLSALLVTLSVSALSQTDASTGNVSGYRVAYQVQLAKDNGSFSTIYDTAFDGTAYNTYTRSHRVELSGATSQYTVRVVRTTADTTSTLIQDTTTVVSYSELIDAKLRYPGSALVGIQLDASQFSSVPTRSYDLKGLLVKYPSNYNPTTRAYSGTWDGTFVTGWTDNPAWIFYDLVLNKRYGAGRWVDASMVDRYSLYTIAQYCDVLVSDGKGGQEPRFTCNCYITSRADAFAVLQNLASVFRGMSYWSAGEVMVTADMPFDPKYTYTAANTVGTFKYVGSSLKTRYTTAAVTWNDPDNGYAQATEYVEDPDGVARYGVIQAELTAFACTSRGQAQRVGHWTLLTSRIETQVCNWSVGLDGTVAQPGQIVAIADPARAGRRMGGRIVGASTNASITLDKMMAEAVVGNTLTLIMPTGTAETKTISGINGNVVTVSAGFSSVPVPQSMWMIESDTVQSQLFRVLTVADSGGIGFALTATQHEPSKYAAIDDGAAIDLRSITGSTINVQVPPDNVAVSQYVVVDQGIAKTNMTISWSAAPGAIGYSVQWRKDNGEWVSAGRTGGLTFDVPNIYTGQYTARVSAINAFDIASPYAYSSLTGVTGKTGAPPVVANFTASTDQVFSIALAWAFPTEATDTAYSEIYYSKTNSFGDAVSMGRFSYPTNTTALLDLAAGTSLWFWIRLVDTTGNVGAFYPSQSGAGVNGQSNSDGTTILGYLTGQIKATQLAQELLAPIQAIPGLQQTVTQTAASLTDETNARVAGDGALATRLSKVEAAYVLPPMAGDPNTFAGATTIYAGVYSEGSARADADLALAQQTDTVTAQIQSTGSNLLAAIQTETTARVNADSATATQITNVQAQVTTNNNTLTAAVQTNANSYADINGRVAASYQIKTQITYNGRTYIAGVGVGVDNTSGTVESQVLVAASRFAVLDPNGTAVSAPFVIQGGQTFISQAFIGTGWITNAMIGGVIQSTAVGANGLPRWSIDKNGVMTVNGGSNGSGYLTINDSTVAVYDGAGTLRVRMGIW